MTINPGKQDRDWHCLERKAVISHKDFSLAFIQCFIPTAKLSSPPPILAQAFIPTGISLGCMCRENPDGKPVGAKTSGNPRAAVAREQAAPPRQRGHHGRDRPPPSPHPPSPRWAPDTGKGPGQQKASPPCSEPQLRVPCSPPWRRASPALR